MSLTNRASVGALGAAFLSALCCAGPLLFVTVGVGAGLASSFEPLRPFLSVLTFAFLGLGFWAVYGRPWMRGRAGRDQGMGGTSVEGVNAKGPGSLAAGEECAVPRSRGREKGILWGATAVALVFWSFPFWSLLLI